MLKKTIVGLVLAFVILVSGFNMETGSMTQVAACRSVTECREQAQTARDNIAAITGNAENISNELAELQELINTSEDYVAAIVADIEQIEAQVDVMELEMTELYEESARTRVIINETDELIEDLIQLMSRRMRATQRFNNRNTMLSQLSTADNLNDFIQVIRQAQRAVSTDSELLEELSTLMDDNRERYDTLQANTERLDNLMESFRDLQAGLEEERAVLEEMQDELIENQLRLQDRLDALYRERQTEAGRLAIIQQAQRIFTQTPPPPVEALNSSGLAHPLPGSRVTSEFGPRWGTHHAGIDVQIFSQPRAPILASASGTVTLAEWHFSMGNWVIIAHDINGQRVDTVYSHLSSLSVAAGDVVTQGQTIGLKGSTGISTGAHLHFEIHLGGFAWNRGVNPRTWINF